VDARFWLSQAFNGISYGALLFLVSSMTSRGKVLAVAGLVIALGVITPHTNSFLILLITRALVLGILAMSLDLLLGFTGLASLGQAAYLGIGAYLTAILATKIPIWAWMELLAGDRLRGLRSAQQRRRCLVSSQCGRAAFFRDDHGGARAMRMGAGLSLEFADRRRQGINLPRRPAFGIQLSDDVTYFYVVFGFFVLSLLLLYILVESPFGRSLVGIREREVRMRILGYNTCLHKYLAFVIAGGFGGLAGVLWAHANGQVSPEDVVLTTSVDALLMVVRGGGNLGGRRHRRRHRRFYARAPQHPGALVAIRAGGPLCSDNPLRGIGDLAVPCFLPHNLRGRRPTASFWPLRARLARR
jgi:branched-chain amino acid transport system permease protein